MTRGVGESDRASHREPSAKQLAICRPLLGRTLLGRTDRLELRWEYQPVGLPRKAVAVALVSATSYPTDRREATNPSLRTLPVQHRASRPPVGADTSSHIEKSA